MPTAPSKATERNFAFALFFFALCCRRRAQGYRWKTECTGVGETTDPHSRACLRFQRW
jgi:hypothetical protein